ncbi:MAG: hypothetical protein Q4B04_06835 [bacterium]|nr:hypothetical protein [bacterium]
MKKILFSVCFCLIFAFVLSGCANLNKAFDLSNYDVFQIKATETVTLYEVEADDSTDSSQSSTDSKNILDYGYTLDKDGNLVSTAELGAEYSSKQDDYSHGEFDSVSTRRYKKNGDIVFVDGEQYDNVYVYKRDVKQYSSYYYDEYGTMDEGYWVEIETNESFNGVFFNIENICQFSASDFNYKKGYFVAKSSKVNKIFSEIILNDDLSLYKDISVKIKVKDNRLDQIILDYEFDGTSSVNHVYKFTYNNTDLTVPEAVPFTDELY